MTEKETRIQALQDFRQALLEDEGVAAKFRAAFPPLAKRLLGEEGKLSDEELGSVSGGRYVSDDELAAHVDSQRDPDDYDPFT